MKVPIRWNILILALVGVAAVVAMSFAFGGGSQDAVIAAGAGLIGGIAAVMSKLAEPEPDRPEQQVPASVVADILRVQRDLVDRVAPLPRFETALEVTAGIDPDPADPDPAA